jgi:excisionase family DNA binding protein
MERRESQSGKKTITVEAAAKELGISRSSAYEAARRGEIPAIVIGRRVLVLRRCLDDILEGRHFEGRERSSAGEPAGAEGGAGKSVHYKLSCGSARLH